MRRCSFLVVVASLLLAAWWVSLNGGQVVFGCDVPLVLDCGGSLVEIARVRGNVKKGVRI